MNHEHDQQVNKLVSVFDQIIGDALEDMEAPNVAAVMLSRVTHLLASCPDIGKELVRTVWEQLDEIEQDNPGDFT